MFLELGTADYYKFKYVMHQRSFILEQRNPFPVEGGSHARVTGQFLRARNRSILGRAGMLNAVRVLLQLPVENLFCSSSCDKRDGRKEH